MTQEEKIQDMLDNPLVYCNDNYQNLVLWAAKEMAEWKNKEFEDYLLEKLKVAEMDYDENSKIGSNSDKLICGVRKATISEIIDELFK